MRKYLFLLPLLLASPVRAWEFSRNPDRFPSIGFNVASDRLSGQRSEIDTPAASPGRVQMGPEKFNTDSIGGDLRVPISNQITMSAFYDALSLSSDFNRAQNVFEEKKKLDGYRVGFSVRFYFNR